MIKKHKFKVRYFLIFVFLIGVLTLGPALNTNAAKVQPGINQGAIDEIMQDQKDKEDTEIYNCNWSKGEALYWRYEFKANFFNPMSWGYAFDKTTVSYIRIMDKNGVPINNVTRIKAGYKLNGKQHLTTRDLDIETGKTGIWFIDETDGNFYSYNQYFDKIQYSTVIFKHDKLAKIFNSNDNTAGQPYQECNYVWVWKASVTDIEYIHIWYIDSESGKEEAISFHKNGEHPRYDSNGKLIGIFDENNKLCEGYGLDEYGFITNEKGETIHLFEEQMVGNIKGDGSYFSNSLDVFGNLLNNETKSNSFLKFLNVLTMIAQWLVIIIVVGLILWLLIVIGKKIFKAVKS